MFLEQQDVDMVNETLSRLWSYLRQKPEIQRACYVPYQRLVNVSELWYRALGVSELAFAIVALYSVMQHCIILTC